MLQQLLILAPPFLLAITFHEYAHGYVAWSLGDPTAQQQGRLTMNPLKHIDPIGILAFIIMKIGWAKPVPINPNYFKDPARGMVWVSLAGPGANFTLALASALFLKLLMLAAPMVPHTILYPLASMVVASVWINLLLGFFNLIPVPPLDGSKILYAFLPPKFAEAYEKLEPFGFFILLALFYLGIISKLIMPLINFSHKLMVG